MREDPSHCAPRASYAAVEGLALKAVVVATLLPLVWKTEQEAELLVETASPFAARIVEATEEVTTNLVQTIEGQWQRLECYRWVQYAFLVHGQQNAKFVAKVFKWKYQQC